jgi:hypothetical protein
VIAASEAALEVQIRGPQSTVSSQQSAVSSHILKISNQQSAISN